MGKPAVEEPHDQNTQFARGHAVASAVRGHALTLLIGGGICLYFGFSWLVDAPGSAGEDTTQTWFAVDRAFQWILRIIGIVFLVAAAWAWSGQRLAILLGAIADAGFALLMLAIAIETTLEARADGGMDAFAILFLILAVIGASGAKRLWGLYAASGRPISIANSSGPQSTLDD